MSNRDNISAVVYIYFPVYIIIVLVSGQLLLSSLFILTHGFHLAIEEVDYLWLWNVGSLDYSEEKVPPSAEPLPPPPTVSDFDNALDWGNDWDGQYPSYYLKYKDDYLVLTNDYDYDEQQYKYNGHEDHNRDYNMYASFFYYYDVMYEELVQDEDYDEEENFWQTEPNGVRIYF